jgi:hypothetical protein
VIDFQWMSGMVPNLSGGFWSVRWTGQIEPQYSDNYIIETRTDDGMKLWINDQLLVDRWFPQSAIQRFTNITLQAGVRYNFRMEYFNYGSVGQAQLYWYSPSQPRQIIPAARFYPASEGFVPGAVISPLYAVAFLGQPFTYTIVGANSPLRFGATNLPPGLSLNSTNGVISGIPGLAGDFNVPISVSNSVGSADAVLHIEVVDTGNSITREVWLGVTGTSITNIPLQSAASLTNTLGSLEGILNFGDNYGERIRGYLTAPETGNYYFWISGNNTAELWISNDDEPVNKVRRAYVSKATATRQWNLQPSQRSGWLTLKAGERYYIEVLHKAGAVANDHWSVGWLQDPTGTNTVPAGVIPGYVLSPFVETPPADVPGTLYSANMVAQAGAVSSGVGTATLRLSADGSQAVLRFGYSGLSSPVTAAHIHADSYLGKNSPGQIVFDVDTATPEPDGSYIWNLMPVGTLSAADLVEIIREGKSYLNIHTVNYPAGEINGHFALADGTATFTAPPSPPAWIDDHSNSNAAARFLLQATFGPSPADIKAVQSSGYKGWINNQFGKRATYHLPNVLALGNANPDALDVSMSTYNTWWQHSVTAPDQLRQRVAFALSEIMVASANGVLQNKPRTLSSYYDVLLKHSFGNFRDLLEAVTLSPAMGLYLDMCGNDKGNIVRGTNPNENYAREILQLFSIGVNRMWPDGTLILNSKGDLVPTYDQDVVIGYSRVFTGWTFYQTNQANKRLPINWYPAANYTNPMVLVPTHHELGSKRLLDNLVLPPAQGTQADASNTNFDAYCSQDLERGLDAIFENQNVGPFICRQLIQRLVTSHPSRDYVYRVVQKFNDNGLGVRGDMKAVITAILLDYEARSTNVLAQATYGKQREPLLRATALARAFPAPAPLSGSYKQSGNQVITVTTLKPHRLHALDSAYLAFAGSPAPASDLYYYVGVTGPKTFTVNAEGISLGTYGQSGYVITVTNSGHGLSVGQQIYLTFTSGGAPNGIRRVATVPGSTVFTVTNSTSAIRSGNCVFPKWTGCDLTQTGSNITFTTTAPHGLKAGGMAYIVFPTGYPATNGTYKVTKVPNPRRFTIVGNVSTDRSDSDAMVLPLVAAPVTRSGSVKVHYHSWGMGDTDSGTSSSLLQTPLNSPTVFNFFFPDYRFQGILASAGLTTPEFQLTSESSIVMQMNFMIGAILGSYNTNGLSGFDWNNGAVRLDIGPWMTTALTSDAGIPALVDGLNTQLCAGQLSPATRTIIVNYVANPRFPYSLPAPTFEQMRDRVRAVVHLIVSSPDFVIQR